MRHKQLLLIAILAAEPGCWFHHAQPVVPVTEDPFRFETKPKEPPPPAYHPVTLPLSPADSDNLEKFLTAGGNLANVRGNTGAGPAAAREYKELIGLLRDNKWTYEQVLDRQVFRKWFRKVQVGGVVDARLDEPPKIPQLAAKSGHYWWIFYIRGHDLTGLMVMREAVPQPKDRGTF